MTEALAGEMAEYGVKVTIAEPGYLRTSFLTPDALAFAINADGAYTGIAQLIADHQALQGSQSGDPAAAARALIDLVDRGATRLRQLPGSAASRPERPRVGNTCGKP